MTHKFTGCFLVLLFLLTARIEAASLVVSPAAKPYNDPEALTLTIAGLPGSGETVRVEQYVDSNGNGSVDAGESLILSFLVTDGKVAMFPAHINSGSSQ